MHSDEILRRRFLQTLGLTTLGAAAGPFAASAESVAADACQLVRDRTLRFIETMRVADGPYGRYRYAAGSKQPTLYSSTYAAMTRHLYGDLGSLSESQRSEWIE